MVKALITVVDGVVRGAQVRVVSKKGRPVLLRRPIQRLYPLEVVSTQSPEPSTDQSSQQGCEVIATENIPQRRSKRVAAMQAKDRILGFLID